MDRHPKLILHRMIFLSKEIKIVICHHEKWDGTGYPFGLRGEQIPLCACFPSNAFDAIPRTNLIASRPYEVAQNY